MRTLLLVWSLWLAHAQALAAEPVKELEKLLERPIIGPRQALLEVQEYTDAKISRMPAVKSAEEWDRIARQLREDVLNKVVYRGAAAGAVRRAGRAREGRAGAAEGLVRNAGNGVRPVALRLREKK
jgi:hypothetical protein